MAPIEKKVRDQLGTIAILMQELKGNKEWNLFQLYYTTAGMGPDCAFTTNAIKNLVANGTYNNIISKLRKVIV